MAIMGTRKANFLLVKDAAANKAIPPMAVKLGGCGKKREAAAIATIIETVMISFLDVFEFIVKIQEFQK